jgi:hypothetical protein
VLVAGQVFIGAKDVPKRWYTLTSILFHPGIIISIQSTKVAFFGVLSLLMPAEALRRGGSRSLRRELPRGDPGGREGMTVNMDSGGDEMAPLGPEWHITCAGRAAEICRNDERFPYIVALARAVNALMFAISMATYIDMNSKEPSAMRDRMNSYLYGTAKCTKL